MFRKKKLLIAFIIISMLTSTASPVLAATVDAISENIIAEEEPVVSAQSNTTVEAEEPTVEQEITNIVEEANNNIEEQPKVEETVAPVNSVEPSIAPSVSANVEPTTTTNNVVENKAEDEVVAEEAEDTVLSESETKIAPDKMLLSKDFISKNGNAYEIKLAFDNKANIPENSRISIKEFEKSSVEYEEAKETVLEDKVSKGENVTLDSFDMLALDISIVDENGIEVEPESTVAVDIKIKSIAGIDDLKEVAESIAVQHHKETESGVVIENVKNNKVATEKSINNTFAINSFSTFTVTWNRNNTNFISTIHYGYMENGRFVEFSQDPAPTDTPTNQHAYLIYDFEGYLYSGNTYLRSNISETPASGGTQIKPELRFNSGRWQYRGTNNGWNNLDGNNANNRHIYLIYDKVQPYTQGGTASPDLDKTPVPPAPTIEKGSEDQDDGTRLLSLSVTGHTTQLEASKLADVIVVFDNSGSMNEDMNGNNTTNNNNRRITIAKNAVNKLADDLLSRTNSSGDKLIRMGLISFSTTGAVTQGLTDTANTFKSAVNGLTPGGGTNWEQALRLANQMAVDSGRKTFVIFVSDGDPTFRETRTNITNTDLDMFGKNGDSDYYASNNVFGEGNADSRGLNYSTALVKAQDIVGAKKDFYTIAISNDATKMARLNSDAGGKGNFLANSASDLEDAFDEIAEQIGGTLGYGANIDDGVTTLTNLKQKAPIVGVDPTSFTYFKNGQPWDPASEDANLATYNTDDGSVEWDLGSNFQLGNNVTYTVKFLVWPDQEALDIVTKLNNQEIEYDSLDAEIKAQIKKSGDTYTLKTNTDDAHVTYQQSTNVGGTITHIGPVETLYYNEVDPLKLDTMTLKVSKIFTDELTQAEDRDDQVTLVLERRVVYDDGTTKDEDWEPFAVPYTVNKTTGERTTSSNIILSDKNEWTAEFYISPGFETNHDGTIVVYDQGYEYRLTEPNIDYHYELNGEIVKPMLVNMKDHEYLGDANGDHALTAENIVKGGINIKKILVNEDNVEIKDDTTEFTIKGYILDAEGNPYTFDPAWDDRTDKSTADGASAIWQQHQNDTGAYHMYDANGNRIGYKLHQASTGAIELKLKGGESVRFINVPKDSTYMFYEENSGSLGRGYSFVSIEGENITKDATGAEIPYSVQPAAPVNNQLSGTVYGNVQHDVTITNQTETVNLTVNKIWDDDNDRDRYRPDSIQVQLYGNGEEVRDQVTLNQSNGWSATYNNLPAYHNGQLIEYTVDELEFDNQGQYTKTIKDLVEVKDNSGKLTGYTAEIENKHTPEKTEVSVLKVWDDANNQDGTRPQVLNVQLLADGEVEGSPVGLTQATGWTYKWEGLNKNKDGEEIQYTVVELDATGTQQTQTISFIDGKVYTITTNTDAEGNVSYIITNQYTPEVVTVKVTKHWDDDDNQDGYRPGSIQVKLLANDSEVTQEGITATQTLSGDSWTYTWTGLNRRAAGEVINYSIDEISLSDEYEQQTPVINVDQTTGNTEIDITNKHEKELVNVDVLKVWNDNNDQDGYRPDSISVQLTADGDALGDPVTLDESNGWAKTWEGLDKNSTNGTPVVYTVEEVEVPEQYNSVITTEVDEETGNTSITVTNTHEKELVNVDVLKVWEDEDNQDGYRPESINVQLTSNGTKLRNPVTLDESNNWSYTWEGLDKNSTNGTPVVYTVEEVDVPEQYDSVITTKVDEETGNTSITVTNTHEIELVDVDVLKVWEDNDNQDGYRPESISVQLTADGEALGEPVTLDESNGWAKTWEGLDKNSTNGTPVVYTVEEVDVPEQYDSVITTEVDDTTGNTSITVTNTHEKELVNVDVLKVWEDEDDQDGYRPDSISVQLTADGEALGEPVTLDESNGWAKTWEGLDKNSTNGTPVVYTVEEVEVPEQYNSVITTEVDEETGNTSITVTNTHEIELVDVDVLKVWEDEDNQDGYRPDSISVQLTADGTALGDPVTLDESNGWAKTWEGLDKNSTNGTPVVYTVEEVDVPEQYNSVITTKVDEETGNTSITVTNTHEIEKTQVSVIKDWQDADNQDGYRPDSVDVILQVNGEPVVQDGITAKQTLNENNSWTYTWEGLNKKADGEKIEYTVVEDGAENNKIVFNEATYNVNVEKLVEAEAGFEYQVTNSYTPGKVTVSVLKQWEDTDNQDGYRPESIQVELYANGQLVEIEGVENPITLNESNRWFGTWTDLDEKSGGNVINYTVKEVGAEEDATTQIINFLNETYTVTYGTNGSEYDRLITNTHVVEKTTATVLKVWEDEDNQDGYRPESITVELLANGNAVSQEGIEATQTLNEANGWTYTWVNLNKKAAGEDIEYTVAEVSVPEQYDSVITTEVDEETGNTSITVTNTHEIELVDVDVLKVWEDNDNQDGYRPDSISVQLTADGTALGEPVTLDESNGWAKTWEGLDKNSTNGTPVVYTVEEVEVPEQYNSVITTKVDDTTGNTSITVTNTHEKELVNVDVLKIWEDEDDQDGYRPDSISVQLTADGTALGEPVTLDESNGWAKTWEGLDKNSTNGTPVVYTVEEVEVPEQYNSVITTKVDDTTGNTSITVTNTHEKELVNVDVLKIWEDEDDQDGYRPDSISVQLTADGEALGEPVTLDESNGWAKTWEDLDKNSTNGTPVVYTVEEVEVPEQYDSVITTEVDDTTGNTSITVTNTHEIELVDVDVLKVWEDEDNQDGYRPDSISVQLTADGTALGEPVTLDESNGWAKTWEGLDKNSTNGTPVVYTVEEVEVPEQYDSVITTVVDEETGNTSITVTNTHEIELVDVDVLKVWEDEDNQDGYRPDSISVQLTADGTALGDAVTLDESNGWTKTWEGLDKNSTNGTPVVYTVEEVEVPEQYDSVITTEVDEETGNTSITVTNTHEIEKVTASVTKVWDDEDNQDGYRSDSVTVQLLANDSGLGEPVTLDESNKWSHTWEELDKKADGKDIEYTVVETEKPEQYEAAIVSETDEDGNFTITVTNTHEVEKIPVTVIKVWDDADNWDGYRPASIDVQLFANGEKVGEIVTLNEENEWTYTWEDMDQKADGKDIEYSVEETVVPEKYEVEYSVDEEGNLIITNTQKPGEGGYEPPPEEPENPGTGSNIFDNVLLYVAIIFAAMGFAIEETRRLTAKQRA